MIKMIFSSCKTNGCKDDSGKRKKAQSGHDGYCKPCFAKKFPEKAKKKMETRKKACELCDSMVELRKGVCKPCWRARGCDPDGKTCDWVNMDPDATRCVGCLSTQSSTTAKQVRLAIRCPVHTTLEQRQSQFCEICQDTFDGLSNIIPH